MDLFNSCTSWEEFVNAFFVDKSKFDLKFYDYGNSTAIKISEVSKNIYIEFEFDNGVKTKFTKLQFGSSANQTVCKGIFNCASELNLEFRQNSWLEEDSKFYSAVINADNLEKVIQFLKVPLEYGWTERQYYFKNSLYKVIIELLANERISVSEVIVQPFEEQDIPSLFDKPFRIAQKLLIDAIFKRKVILKEIKVR